MDNMMLHYTLEKMKCSGFDRSQCLLKAIKKQELNIENNKISLLRSGREQTLDITGIANNRKASLSLNTLSKSAVDQAVSRLLEMADGTEPNDAHDIAPNQPTETFICGPKEINLDAMYDCLHSFLHFVTTDYPAITLVECALDFTQTQTQLINSNAVDFTETHSTYNGSTLFTATDGQNISSFNATGFSSFDLRLPMHKYGTIEQLLNNTANSVQTKSIPSKFIGDIIIMPDALGDFTDFLTRSISDRSIIAGTSLYRKKLGQQIASSLLTIKSLPLDPKLCRGYHFTSDGFKAQDLCILNKGVLNSHLLSQYGARKTGLARANNQGDSIVIEPGNTPLHEIISSVKEGVIVGRLSAAAPADKGDFSGVVKNSFYIRNGKLQYPLSETMISGNMARIFQDVTAVSKEVINFGHCRVP